MQDLRKIKLLIVESQALMREGLCALVDTSIFEIVDACESAESAMVALKEKAPDVVLVDANLSDLSGLEAARKVQSLAPTAKVILMSSVTTEGDVLHALNLNVKGFVLKGSCCATTLNQTLRLVAAGESVFPSAILKGSMRRASDGDRMNGLTRRENEILRYIAQGDSNKAIARTLDLSEGTVKVHVKAILKKLNMSNRTQAAIFAHERGMSADRV